MSLRITRYEKKWRVCISDETLEFENKKTMKEELFKLLDIKEKYEPR